MTDLSSARAKLRWASLHIEQVNLIYQSIVNGNFYTMRQRNDGNGRHVIEVASLAKIPPEFALEVGDATANLRSVLDHIVFAFAEKPLAPSEEQRLQFPVASCPSNFADAIKKKNLFRVPQPAIDLIERFQPYNCGKSPDNELLAKIQALNNWDKHRALSISYTRRKRSTLEMAPESYNYKLCMKGKEVAYS